MSDRRLLHNHGVLNDRGGPLQVRKSQCATANQGLSALVERPTSAPLAENWKEGGYLDRLPVDPWGQPYQYVQPGLHGPFDLYSFGADGRPSGQGINADVGNWETE